MRLFAFFLIVSLCLAATAREATPLYKFSVGTTNVFAVEISVRSEIGSDVLTGNVVVVTKTLTTNSVKLGFYGKLTKQIWRTSERPSWMTSGHYAGSSIPVFPHDCEIELNYKGIELRDEGDYLLAIPLGKLAQSLFEPLPAKWGREEISDTVSVLDEPSWIGPASSFLPVMAIDDPYISSVRFSGYPGNPQKTFATLLLSRHVSNNAKNTTSGNVEWRKLTKFRSFTMNGSEPRLTATSDSIFTFDRNFGLLTAIETQADVLSQTETTVRKAKVSFKAHLLQGTAFADALEALKYVLPVRNIAPLTTAPALPRKLDAADLSKILRGLQSSDVETRRFNMVQLEGVIVENPSDEFINTVASLMTDSDGYIRVTAANFVANHATTNQVPVLVKMMKESNLSSRERLIRTLIKLKDQRAIQPIADLVTRDGALNSLDAQSALIAFGPAAEKPVLALLAERKAETKRAACKILKQIGTSESLPALQELVGDGDESISQAAAEAIRAIKQRQ